MRIVLSLFLLVTAAAINGCSSSSSAGEPTVTMESFGDFDLITMAVPVDAGPYVMRCDVDGMDQVCRTDLTPEGTEVLLEEASILFENPWRGRAFLLVGLRDGGYESIWMTNGTVEETQWVADIAPPSGFFSQNFVLLDGDRLIITGTVVDGLIETPQMIVIDL